MRLTLVLGLSGIVVGACTNEPEYIQAPTQLEATGMELDPMGNEIGVKASLMIPFKTETTDDAAARAKLAATLMVDVPYVKVGDVAVSIEWTIKNLDTMDGIAKIELNGANEFFSFDPSLVMLGDPNDPEAPPTPGLDGDVPIHIPAGGTVSGLFREDELEEASIDLDQITRGNVSPFAAVISIDRNKDMFQPMTPPMPGVMDFVQTPTGPAIPRAAFANLVQVDLVFKPDRHMVLEFAVRVRDTRGILDEKLLTAPMSELQQFMPMPYAVSAP